MGLNEEAFDVLRQSLLLVRPELRAREVVLCPICLREITKEQVLKGGIEHIIPQDAVRRDKKSISVLGTKNQRCGITVLCRTPRMIAGTGSMARQGCNGFKGSAYDYTMRRLLDDRPRAADGLTHRVGVAILVMAYLGAFQTFGYDYILRPALDEIRRQFDHPDRRVTGWLEHARYNLAGGEGVHATDSGQPFVHGGVMSPTGDLHIMFRRCDALLPRGHWQSRGVASLETLLAT